jgi:glutathione-regulated potassium-efflux system ancillary protein KefC
LALWAGSEAVLPAYLIGMVLAGTVGKDHSLIRRLRTLTFGFLTPFYFIRAGSFVSVPALLAAPVVLLVLFSAKMLTKIVAVFPAVRFHKYVGDAGVYYTLMMSTGLTFGTISALFGLNHKIISQAQYSFVVGTVIASAVIPTIAANMFFLPRHLLPRKDDDGASEKVAEQPAKAGAV